MLDRLAMSNLEVHHQQFRSPAGEDAELLITLGRRCHARYTRRIPECRRELSTARRRSAAKSQFRYYFETSFRKSLAGKSASIGNVSAILFEPNSGIFLAS